jgi:acyl-CoA synthetase (AMP-forming)/AMP-acid ligase II
VGGFNAYPAEIENVLLGHPLVGEVAVVGAPDDRLGEVGVAFVVARDPADLDARELGVWASERLANFKVPRHTELVSALPANAVGKVLRYRARAAAPVSRS